MKKIWYNFTENFRFYRYVIAMGRVIFLVDMNAFFISCEAARNPSLKGRPAAVAGDPKKRSGIILAANYEARRYNVKTTMLIHEAKKLCPDIIIVPPDHRLYKRKSREVMSILSRYSPVIQQNSIDEAWLDLTGCEALFGTPRKIAERIMKDIMGELDLWCSIGISENKFLAKMASEMKKPLGITEVWTKDIQEKIWPLPVRQMYGVGKQTERKLNNLAIFTIGDIAKSNKNILVRAFGKYGEELHRLANGIDPSPVVNCADHENKSISRSTTLPKDTVDIEYLKTILLELAEEVGAEARKKDYKGTSVYITIKYGDFQSITRQRAVPPTYLTKDIYQTGVDLLELNWSCSRPVRLIGIGLGNIEENCFKQLSIFDLEGSRVQDNKEEKLEKAVDSLREKFGQEKIKRAKSILKG